MSEEEIEMAVCGLQCRECDVYLVTSDDNAAKSVCSWFREMGWLKEGETMADFLSKAPYCTGCRGDREKHWSPDCQILLCCVDGKGLDNCSECSDFPCDKLENRAGEDDRYAEALETLKGMRIDGEPTREEGVK